MLYKLVLWIYHYIMGTKPVEIDENEKQATGTISSETDKVINAVPDKGLEKKENLAGGCPPEDCGDKQKG